MSEAVGKNNCLSPSRLVAGFIAAIFTPPVLMVGWGILSGLDRLQAALLSLMLLPFYLFFSAVAILLIGGPIFWLLARAKWISFASILTTGLVGGAAVELVIYAIGWRMDKTGYAFYLGEGVLSALVFWWVAVRVTANRAV